jgi:hypothetical protein
MLPREDVEMYLLAPQTKTAHFWLWAWTKYHNDKWYHFYETSGPYYAGGYVKCPHSHWQ